MRPHFLVTAFTMLSITLMFSISQVNAAGNLLFILDSSGSMAGKLEGSAKMDTAKTALSKLLGDLPNDTSVGLMAYGHRVGRKDPGSCEDIELLVPVGGANPSEVTNWLARINPKGKTPIAGSLRQTPGAFAGSDNSNNNVVLISDGIETCDGDPCAVAGELVKSHINVRVHVIGFDISDKDRAQLECIAESGNGKYFPVNSTEGFANAVTEAVKVAQVETTPAPAQTVIWFEDNFDGDALAEHWEVINPNPDAFIVENGVLTILTSQEKSLIGTDEVENIFGLTKEMPKGDWTATVRYTPEVATFRESFNLALYKDKDNMLAATTWQGVDGQSVAIGLQGNKVAKGKKAGFGVRVLTGDPIGMLHANLNKFLDWTSANEKAVLLRIEKSGRNYIISSKVEGDLTMADGKQPQWVKIQKLTSLRSPGNSLVLALTQRPLDHPDYDVQGGEALVNVDWIKIEVQK